MLTDLVPVNRTLGVIFLLGALVAFALWRPLARRLRWRAIPTLGLLLSVAAICALTLNPSGYHILYPVFYRRLPSAHALRRLLTSTGGQLNILLFIPFGLCATLATRRLLGPLLAGVLLSITVEALQLLPAISRISALEDLITNSIGTAIGVACGGAWLLAEAILSRRVRGSR